MRLTVREAREKACISQVDAARSIGVTEPTYRKYECYPERMPLWMAAALSKLFGRDFAEIEFHPEIKAHS